MTERKQLKDIKMKTPDRSETYKKHLWFGGFITPQLYKPMWSLAVWKSPCGGPSIDFPIYTVTTKECVLQLTSFGFHCLGFTPFNPLEERIASEDRRLPRPEGPKNGSENKLIFLAPRWVTDQ